MFFIHANTYESFVLMASMLSSWLQSESSVKQLHAALSDEYRSQCRRREGSRTDDTKLTSWQVYREAYVTLLGVVSGKGKER